jgi:steroid delta-isomerase-like uncharacterized protein
MSTEANKAIIRRLVEKFWNKGDAQVLDEVFAQNFLDHSGFSEPGSGQEGIKQAISGYRAAFSENTVSLDNLIAEGDKVVWRWTHRGVHSGPVMNIPATGKPINLTGITIDRFAGSQVVERWSQADSMGLMQQLGLTPTPQ